MKNKYKACPNCTKDRSSGNFDNIVNCNWCDGSGIIRLVTSYLCNQCGGSMTVKHDHTSPYGLVEASVSGHYASEELNDLTTYIFSLCEGCLRKLFNSFKISPKVIDRLGYEEYTYEQDLECYNKRD